MKLILLCLIAINSVSGKCPPEQVVAPCTCGLLTGTISCQHDLTQVSKVFHSISKYFGANEKNFRGVKLEHNGRSPLTLEDNVFSDITFESFYGANIEKIGSNVFHKTANNITTFNCYDCFLQHQSPKYDFQTIFSEMNQLYSLNLGLNVTEIPTGTFGTSRNKANLNQIRIQSKGLTIKSGAFQNLKNLQLIRLYHTEISKIEKEAFKFINTNNLLTIDVTACPLTNQSFQNGSFDGMLRSLIKFDSVKISNLPEEAFKSFLDNGNSIHLSNGFYGLINCSDCKNYWLIEQKRDDQVYDVHCYHDVRKTLFDEETKNELRQKCKR